MEPTLRRPGALFSGSRDARLPVFLPPLKRGDGAPGGARELRYGCPCTAGDGPAGRTSRSASAPTAKSPLPGFAACGVRAASDVGRCASRGSTATPLSGTAPCSVIKRRDRRRPRMSEARQEYNPWEKSQDFVWSRLRATVPRPTRAGGRPCPTPKPFTPCSPPPARPRHGRLHRDAALRRAAGRGAPLRAAASARHRRRDDRGRARHDRDAGRDGDRSRCGRRAPIPVPGRARRADLLDAAFLGGTAAHGIELDDGYRHGSAHCGCVVVPAVLAVAYQRRATRPRADRGDRRGLRDQHRLARACAPDLRQRGFHPTSAVGPFGAAMATGKLRGLDATAARQRARHRGVERRRACSPSSTAAATSSGCTPATPRARACRRRCSPSRASKARRNVIEARDGFMQAFAFGRIDKARPIALPPQAEYGITDCYIKPYACCRHIQPAVEAMFGLLQRREDQRSRTSARSRSRPTRSRPSTRTCRGTISPARN